MSSRLALPVAVALTCLPGISQLRAQMPNPYGLSIAIEDAKKTAALAVAEARKNNWNMAVSIVDTAGNLVYFEKMDGTQVGSVNVSLDKARSAAPFKRPSKAFQDASPRGATDFESCAWKARCRSRVAFRCSSTGRSSAPSAFREAPARGTANAPRRVRTA